jgi:phosphate transport system protein
VRTEFHAELDQLSSELGEMCGIAASLMECATVALVRADGPCLDRVPAELARLDAIDARARDRAMALLALQAPVARDLRMVVSAIQIAADADRMGGLAANVAKIARRHHPDVAVPEVAAEHFVRMGRVAVDLARDVQSAVLTGDVDHAQRVQHDDELMDDLNRGLFGLLTDLRWGHGTASAVDVVLLGRFYERFADHAVEIARRIVFRSTGRAPLRTEEPRAHVIRR